MPSSGVVTRPWSATAAWTTSILWEGLIKAIQVVHLDRQVFISGMKQKAFITDLLVQQQSFGDQPYGANDGYNQQQIPPPQYPTHQQPPYVDSASVPVPQQGQAPNVQGMAYGDGVPYYQQPPQQQGGSMNPYGEAAQYFNQQRGYAGPAETGNQGNPSAYEGSMYPEPPQGAEPQGSVYPLKKKSYRHKRRPDPKVDVEAGDASVSANPFQEHRN